MSQATRSVLAVLGSVLLGVALMFASSYIPVDKLTNGFDAMRVIVYQRS